MGSDNAEEDEELMRLREGLRQSASGKAFWIIQYIRTEYELNIIEGSAVISPHNYDIEAGKHFLGNCPRLSRFRRPLSALGDMTQGIKGFRICEKGFDANTLALGK